jgi:hypothetical protein
MAKSAGKAPPRRGLPAKGFVCHPEHGRAEISAGTLLTCQAGSHMPSRRFGLSLQHHLSEQTRCLDGLAEALVLCRGKEDIIELKWCCGVARVESNPSGNAASRCRAGDGGSRAAMMAPHLSGVVFRRAAGLTRGEAPLADSTQLVRRRRTQRRGDGCTVVAAGGLVARDRAARTRMRSRGRGEADGGLSKA